MVKRIIMRLINAWIQEALIDAIARGLVAGYNHAKEEQIVTRLRRARRYKE